MATLTKGWAHIGTAIATDGAIGRHIGYSELVLKLALQEMLLEVERAENFPSRPSRIGSIMVFRTEQAAAAFNDNYREGIGVIHACQIKTRTRFDSWMEWTSGGSAGAANFDEIIAGKRARAASYWRPDQPSTPIYAETLVHGEVWVVG